MKFTVPQELDGITVQNFLRKHCFVSARMLTKLKRVENGITLDGKLIRSIDILHGGDTVKLILPKESVHIEPVNLPLDNVYEDEWLIVYNKPPFMPVHPVRDHQLDTLANAAAFHAALLFCFSGHISRSQVLHFCRPAYRKSANLPQQEFYFCLFQVYRSAHDQKMPCLVSAHSFHRKYIAFG